MISEDNKVLCHMSHVDLLQSAKFSYHNIRVLVRCGEQSDYLCFHGRC